MAKTLTILLTTLAATGAGYAVGILVAPKSGRDTRHDMQRRARVIADKIVGRINQGGQKIQRTATAVRRKMKEMTDVQQGRTRSATAHPAV